MKYKMIATDMDGTLLDDAKNISPVTLNIIKQAINDGALFAFSTGRPQQAIFKYRNIVSPDSYIIAYNGAMIMSGDNEIIFEQGLSTESAIQILDYVKYYDTTACIWSRNKLYVNKLNQRAAIYKKNVMTEPLLCTDIDKLLEQGITKILWFDTPERTIQFQNELRDVLNKDTVFCPSTAEYLEFFSSKVSKGLAIERLAARHNIKREEIIAFGDNCNDIEMIEYAGLGVAMANSPDIVKQSADYITLDNNNDGVAHALSQFLG